jgi:hypothetical protein
MGEECIFTPKKVTVTFWPASQGDMQNSTTGKTLIVYLIALSSEISLSRRERPSGLARFAAPI